MFIECLFATHYLFKSIQRWPLQSTNLSKHENGYNPVKLIDTELKYDVLFIHEI